MWYSYCVLKINQMCMPDIITIYRTTAEYDPFKDLLSSISILDSLVLLKLGSYILQQSIMTVHIIRGEDSTRRLKI